MADKILVSMWSNVYLISKSKFLRVTNRSVCQSICHRAVTFDIQPTATSTECGLLAIATIPTIYYYDDSFNKF